MGSLWTPDGERQVPPPEQNTPTAAPEPEDDPLRAAAAAIGVDLDALDDEEKAQLRAELEEMMRVRRQVAATPVADVLANHMMRLFDLVTIYLEASPPGFAEAATVIEAYRGTLDAVEDRLGDHAPMLRDALGQAQMLFVQVKDATGPPADQGSG
jgi:hypothetical protein